MRLSVSSCMIDGEAVACGEDGIASRDFLRHKRNQGYGFLYAFDVIEWAVKTCGETPWSNGRDPWAYAQE
jgi:hypothetical protein